MNRPHRSPRLPAGGWLVCCLGCLAIMAGCAEDPKPVVKPPKYDARPAKQGLPAFMHNTIWEKVDVGNTEAFMVSAYGLVVNLDNTGDSTAPYAVRSYILKEMVKHGYGSKLQPGWEHQSPDRVLTTSGWPSCRWSVCFRRACAKASRLTPSCRHCLKIKPPAWPAANCT